MTTPKPRLLTRVKSSLDAFKGVAKSSFKQKSKNKGNDLSASVKNASPKTLKRISEQFWGDSSSLRADSSYVRSDSTKLIETDIDALFCNEECSNSENVDSSRTEDKGCNSVVAHSSRNEGNFSSRNEGNFSRSEGVRSSRSEGKCFESESVDSSRGQENFSRSEDVRSSKKEGESSKSENICSSKRSSVDSSNLPIINIDAVCSRNPDSYSNKENGILSVSLDRESILNDLEKSLGNILEYRMKDVYGEKTWTKIILHKPPWSLLNILQCWDKHWIAALMDEFDNGLHVLLKRLIFFLRFPNNVMDDLKTLSIRIYKFLYKPTWIPMLCKGKLLDFFIASNNIPRRKSDMCDYKKIQKVEEVDRRKSDICDKRKLRKPPDFCPFNSTSLKKSDISDKRKLKKSSNVCLFNSISPKKNYMCKLETPQKIENEAKEDHQMEISPNRKTETVSSPYTNTEIVSSSAIINSDGSEACMSAEENASKNSSPHAYPASAATRLDASQTFHSGKDVDNFDSGKDVENDLHQILLKTGMRMMSLV